MHPFAYIAPKTVEEAVAVLNKHGDRARPIAGGTDLLVQARGGRFDLDAVVDIKKIPELESIKNGASGLEFGAAVPCYQLYENKKLAAEYPGIMDAASLIGGIQIQSRAGLGGNLCNATPSGDGIGPLIVHYGTAVIAGPGGRRELAVEKFCTGPGRNALKKGELLVSLKFPKPSATFGAAYERFIPRNEMDIAVAGVAVSVELSADKKTIKKARVALASVAPTPVLAEAAGAALIGKSADDEAAINAAGAAAAKAAKPITDMRGTIEQRKHLVEVLTKRMIRKAVERARS
ncbi:MAG: xanthine dehydrogenase family protein subunit M [Chloroflexi bacterium]|nr:xanthine dehydrogenase family protein subunit M [Chloroflexota bacterium]MDA1297476.1 xanthine dehydrogenase family protein subunit M [Chloroflexota bacterium]